MNSPYYHKNFSLYLFYAAHTKIQYIHILWNNGRIVRSLLLKQCQDSQGNTSSEMKWPFKMTLLEILNALNSVPL